MMHKAWSTIEEVPYCFSSSYVKLQGHTALKIVEFDPNWAFPDCNSSFNSSVATKWCTKLEVALKRCPIVFWYAPEKKVEQTIETPVIWDAIAFIIIKGGFRVGRTERQPPIFFSKYDFSCDQAALWMAQSVRLSVCLWHLFHYVPVIVSSWNFQRLLPLTQGMSMQKVKVKGQGHRGHDPT